MAEAWDASNEAYEKLKQRLDAATANLIESRLAIDLGQAGVLNNVHPQYAAALLNQQLSRLGEMERAISDELAKQGLIAQQRFDQVLQTDNVLAIAAARNNLALHAERVRSQIQRQNAPLSQ